MKDIVEWDVVNWSRAISFWEKDIHDKDLTGKKVLDIGGRNGGISLFFALKGCNVICSDINKDGFQKARALHEKYNVYTKYIGPYLDYSRPMGEKNKLDHQRWAELPEREKLPSFMRTDKVLPYYDELRKHMAG